VPGVAFEPAKYAAVQPEDSARALNRRGKFLDRIEPIENGSQVMHMFLIERAVTAQIRESVVGQAKRLLNSVGSGDSKRHARSF
jgi:hypothetical protein